MRDQIVSVKAPAAPTEYVGRVRTGCTRPPAFQLLSLPPDCGNHVGDTRVVAIEVGSEPFSGLPDCGDNLGGARPVIPPMQLLRRLRGEREHVGVGTASGRSDVEIAQSQVTPRPQFTPPPLYVPDRFAARVDLGPLSRRKHDGG